MSKKIKKNGEYFWNTIAGLINAGEAVILSMAVTRTTGLADAGILSIAFAIGNLMLTIGKFGVRNFQVTDVKNRFTFSDYFWARMFTAGLMAVTSLIYIFYCVQRKGYGVRKAIIILAICMIYLTEAVEDVFWGLYQKKQAIAVGAKIFISRWMLILICFIFILIRERDLQTASVVSIPVGIVVFFVFNSLAFHSFNERIEAVRIGAVSQMLEQCFPLFAVSFLTFYVTNAPKYAIDRYLPQEVQACYGFIAMPVFVIGLLNSFLYQPLLVQMAVEWSEGRVRNFQRRVRKQCLVLTGLTIGCLSGAYLFGIPVLSMLYVIDLDAFQLEFMVLILGGGMMAFAGYFCVLLTIFRRQQLILNGYIATAVLALLFSNMAVKAYGVMGAAVFYTFLMTLLAFFFSFLYIREIHRSRQIGSAK